MLSHLMACDEFDNSPLYIFCDGPKSESDREAVNQTRASVRGMVGQRAIITEQSSNKGLAQSIIDGVSEICHRHGSVIVIEDDLLVSPLFLDYMNAALDRYKEEAVIKQISGYMFPVDLKSEEDAVFLPFTTSWGWATWDRAWREFDPNMTYYETIAKDAKLRKAYDFNGTSPQFKMLTQQKKGQLDSWAVRWYLSVFKAKGLVVHPTHSLVKNVGFDGSGTHSTKTNYIEASPFSLKPVSKWPNLGSVNQTAYAQIQSYLKKQNNIVNKLLNRVKRIILESD